MVKMGTLGEFIAKLDQLDDEEAICAAEPWTEQSPAVVIPYPEDDGLPEEVEKAGMVPFLEVGIAREVVEDWLNFKKGKATPTELCNRVIQYAINDA